MSIKDFDWEYYLVKYPDLANAGINTKQKAIVHYKRYGAKEKRFGSKKEEVITKRIASNKKYKNLEKSINDDISNNSDSLYKGFSFNKSKSEFESESKSFSKSTESNLIIKKLNSIENLILSLQNEVEYIKNNFISLNDISSKFESIETNNSNSGKIESTETNNSNSSKNNINLSNNHTHDSKSLALKVTKLDNISDNRIESSEEYELKDNLSEENNYDDDESENESENSDVIVKYSNSDENIASKETKQSFSNLSYDK